MSEEKREGEDLKAKAKGLQCIHQYNISRKMQYSKREAHDIKRALENVLHETISAKVLQVEAAEKGGGVCSKAS